MNLKQAKAKIKELEERIRALEVRPAQEIHYHYPAYYYLPQPLPAPVWQPWPVVIGTASRYALGAGATDYVVSQNAMITGAAAGQMSDGLQWS